MSDRLNRRQFARIVAAGAGVGAWLHGESAVAPSHRTLDESGGPDEQFWARVRAEFLLPRDLGYLNAANLCPVPRPVLEAVERNSRQAEADPSVGGRAALIRGKETSRQLVAELLGVEAAEIVLTRNASEANCLIVNGLDLPTGSEILVFGDNHPSNLASWRERADRAGWTVVTVPAAVPHPGAEHYIAAFTKAITPKTRVMAITHVSNTVGDRLPVVELAALARSRGILCHVDGAQSLGVLEVDVRSLGCDSYSGSAHKWLCGPKETGVLFVRREVHERIRPSVVSLYPGAVGLSAKVEALGQRDDAALAALGEAVQFNRRIGSDRVARRARELTEALTGGLRRIDGIRLWTDPVPDRSAAVVAFAPGSLDPLRLAEVLYQRDRLVVAGRAGPERPAIRVSPHVFNSFAEIERLLRRLDHYLTAGL